MFQLLKQIAGARVPTMAGKVTQTALRRELRAKLKAIYSAAPKGTGQEAIAVKMALGVASQLVERAPDADLNGFVRGLFYHVQDLHDYTVNPDGGSE